MIFGYNRFGNAFADYILFHIIRVWKPFKNSARTDKAVFYHWVKQREASDGSRQHPFLCDNDKLTFCSQTTDLQSLTRK